MFHIEKPSDVWIPFLLYLGILSRLCVGRRSQPSFLPFFFLTIYIKSYEIAILVGRTWPNVGKFLSLAECTHMYLYVLIDDILYR